MKQKSRFVFVGLMVSVLATSLLTMSFDVSALDSKMPEYLVGETNKKLDRNGKVIYNGEFFANGTPITITAPTSEGKTATIVWDGGKQEIDADDAVYGGSDTTVTDIELTSTSITMNGGTVKLLIAGNKMKNETKTTKSQIGTATVDINGGVISQGLSGIDNQNTAFGINVLKDKKYTNYSINTLNVTIDGAKVNDFRGITSYTYVNNMNITVGKDKSAELGNMIWGTNGVINNANFTMYSGTTEVAKSILRTNILTKMTYNFLGGKTGVISAGSDYPISESAAGSSNWAGWNAGDINYGFANAIEINIAKGVVYKDIVSGFQFRNEDINTFKNKYTSNAWMIDDLKEDATVTLNLSSKPSVETLDKYSLVNSTMSNVKTNWKVTDVSLDKTSSTLTVGQTLDLKAMINPEYATNKTVVWSSSDTKVATVKDGKVVAVSAGVTKITATVDGKIATCTVTVNAVSQPIKPDKPQVPDKPLQPEMPSITPSNPNDDVIIEVADKGSEKIMEDTVDSIIKDIVSGKDISTNIMSSETAEAVKAAIESGKKIETKVQSKALEESEVAKEVVTKVNSLILVLEKDNDSKITVLEYLDLGIMLMADNQELGNLNVLDGAISFTINVPQGMQGKDGNFYIVRIHDGKAEKINTVKNSDGTLTFKTDRFSTYALAYEEKTTDSLVKTDDSSQMMIFASLACLGIVSGALVILFKKRDELLNK